MNKIFISYNAKDLSIAKDVFDILQKYQVDVWLDINKIRVGDNIEIKIHDAISSSQILIAIVTHNSVDSVWVQKELKHAISENHNRELPRIIPIVLEGTTIPDFLKGYKYILLQPYDYHLMLERQLDDIIVQTLVRLSVLAKKNTFLIGKSEAKLWAKELSKDFYDKPVSYDVQKVEHCEAESESANLDKIKQKLRKEARGYTIKANITLCLMALLILAATYLFYTAGSIVQVENKISNPVNPDTVKNVLLQVNNNKSVSK